MRLDPEELFHIAVALSSNGVRRDPLVMAIKNAEHRKLLSPLQTGDQVQAFEHDLLRLSSWGRASDGTLSLLDYLSAAKRYVAPADDRARIDTAMQLLAASLDVANLLATLDSHAIAAALREFKVGPSIDDALPTLALTGNLEPFMARVRDLTGATQVPPGATGRSLAGSHIDEVWKQEEVITGPRSTLLPISFLQTGVERGRAVGIVQLGHGMSGTGFLVAGGLVVTNSHVLPSKEIALRATIAFDYDAIGTPLQRTVGFDVERWFQTSAADDWTVVAVAAGADLPPPLPLSVRVLKPGDSVQIIQHPGGGPKKIAIHRNEVTSVLPKRIQYLTDTMPGSSGSPVFDEDWHVVAVHHSGGWKQNSANDRRWCNEGTTIDVVRKGLPPLANLSAAVAEGAGGSPDPFRR